MGGNGSVKVASDSTLSEWNALPAGVEVALAGSEALRIVRTDTKHDHLLPVVESQVYLACSYLNSLGPYGGVGVSGTAFISAPLASSWAVY